MDHDFSPVLALDSAAHPDGAGAAVAAEHIDSAVDILISSDRDTRVHRSAADKVPNSAVVAAEERHFSG